MLNTREVRGFGLYCTVLRKPELSVRLIRKQGLNLLCSIKIGLRDIGKKVMWCYESRFALFQGDGLIRVRKRQMK